MSALQQIDLPGMPAPIRKEPESMVALAIQQGASIDIIERLVALQDKMLARQAEEAFNVAMNRAQAELGPVQTDLTNPQTKSRYASYNALDRKVRPIYGRHGFSLSFDTDPSAPADTVIVLCYVSHAAGHSRTYRCSMPADGKGAKGGDVMTKTHATGAAQSYGMRYLLKMIFNIAIGEDDRDGNTFNSLSERLEWIANANGLEELQRIFKTAYKDANDARDRHAMQELVAAKDKRKAELQ